MNWVAMLCFIAFSSGMAVLFIGVWLGIEATCRSEHRKTTILTLVLLAVFLASGALAAGLS